MLRSTFTSRRWARPEGATTHARNGPPDFRQTREMDHLLSIVRARSSPGAARGDRQTVSLQRDPGGYMFRKFAKCADSSACRALVRTRAPCARIEMTSQRPNVSTCGASRISQTPDAQYTFSADSLIPVIARKAMSEKQAADLIDIDQLRKACAIECRSVVISQHGPRQPVIAHRPDDGRRESALVLQADEEVGAM